MKKLAFGILLSLFLILLIAPAAMAADIYLVSDAAYLLTDDEYWELNERADEIAVLYHCEVAIITLDEIGGADAEEYAKYLYEEYNFGVGMQKSGLLLFLSMEERDYALIAHGFGNTAFTDHGKDVLLDKHVLPLLAKDDYYGAFSTYLETAADYLDMARSGTPFDTDTDPDHGRLAKPIKLAIVIFVPLLISGGLCLFWRSQMKTAVAAKGADNYIPADGFRLTRQEDRFLFSNETRRRIESKRSSGGTSVKSDGYSGRSGKF